MTILVIVLAVLVGWPVIAFLAALVMAQWLKRYAR